MPYNKKMTETGENREEQAASASEDRIILFVHDASPKVIRALLANRNITAEHVQIIAGRKNLPGEVLESIIKDKRWADSYPIRLALARNPKTPLFAALSVARYLRLFDQVELTRNHFLPIIFRRKLEAIITEKFPAMPLGIKKTLAKIAAGDILLKLIQDGYPEVVSLCLSNPHLVEAHLYTVINRKTTTPGTIRTIAEHPAWSSRYNIKFALIRNEHTPLARSVFFLPDILTRDLKDLYHDLSVPIGIKPSIHRELWERGEEPGEAGADEEKVFEIDEKEMDELENEVKGFGEETGAERDE